MLGILLHQLRTHAVPVLDFANTGSWNSGQPHSAPWGYIPGAIRLIVIIETNLDYLNDWLAADVNHASADNQDTVSRRDVNRAM